MIEKTPSLLVTKLYIPRPRAAHIARPALVGILNTSSQYKLTLVAAAAGFGKTSLVAEWCSQQSQAVAWLALDSGDNDPIRFFAYLIAAVQQPQPQFGQALLSALQSPQPPALDHALPSLINQLATLPTPLTLVLDDYHLIDNPTLQQAMTFLLDHLPPQVHLMMLTRSDPPLPLARLRAKHELLEIRAAALRFSPEESAAFFNDTMGVNLSPQAIQALDQRTEGWITGLQLAAIALQSHTGDTQTFVEHFTGSHRFVLDYLIEEVLSQQPEAVRRFLLHTSILERLNADLCAALTGEAAEEMLAYLEKHNLFLIPLDQARYWYRYHHLFADLLQARLQAEYSPKIVQDLGQQAAHWYADQRLPEEAIFYALRAQDFVYAAELITGPGAGVMQRGEVATLLEWYKAFPHEVVEQQPRLSLQFGIAFALSGRWEEAEALLKTVEQGQSLPPEEYLLLAYLVASYRQDKARLASIATEAANAQPNRIAKMVLGLVVSLQGDLEGACQWLRESQTLSERDGDYALALTALFHQCRFQVFLGHLEQAYQLCHTALEHRQSSGAALAMTTVAHVSLGRIWLEWHDLDQATYHLNEAIRLAEQSSFVTGMLSSATMMLAEVQQGRGESQHANETTQLALAYAERYDPPQEVLWLKTYQARLWLAQGNYMAAATWATETPPTALSMFYPRPIQELTLARVWLGQRKIEAAIQSLTKLLEAPHHLLTVEILAVLALARQAQGDSVHAMLTLEQTLKLAVPEKRIRVFLDLGQPMSKLLTRFYEANPQHEFVREVLKTFPESLDQQPDPLSEREVEILRLIVAGYSNEEIAQRLVLALSTVKWYINVLYGKLGVKTRSQAIAHAHERHLLDI